MSNQPIGIRARATAHSAVFFLMGASVFSLPYAPALAATTYPQPVISSFTPSSGGAGTVITITGTGLLGADHAWIGAAHDAKIDVISNTEATITVPADSKGGQLAILNPQHAAFSWTNFTETKAAATLVQPSISNFSPSSGPIGTVITITGSGFTGLTHAWIGAAHDAAVTAVSNGVVRITVPADSVGGQIALLNPQYAAFSATPFEQTAVIAPPVVDTALGSASYAVAPSAGTLAVTATLSGTPSGAVSVNYATANGTAVAGTDYTATSGVLTWASGSTAAKSFSIPIATGGAGGKSFTVSLSNATGATIATPGSSTISITTAPSTPTPTLSVRVQGNHLIDANGNTLQLRGANMSGLEFVGVQGMDVATWGGTIPNWSVFQTWAPNAVRIPLNAASWLGLTTYTADANPATSFGSQVLADPQGDYKQTVINAVAAAQKAGLNVILDLHWSAPQVTLNGVTHYITPNGQPEFMNASTDIAFWQSIAATFGTQATPQPGVSNAGILFELFNEPYIDYYASGSTLYGLMLNGGTVAKFSWAIGAYSVSPSGGVAIAGYQQVLNAIRALGANNVCIINGPSYTQEAQYYKQWFPTDTLSTPQLAAGWHPYPNGTYPYSNGDVYGKIGNDAGGGTASFAQWFEAILAAGTPVIITEDGGEGGTAASSGEPHMAYMESWADSHGASYLAWEWTEPQPYGTSETQNLLTAYGSNGSTILPIEGAGATLYSWFLAH